MRVGLLRCDDVVEPLRHIAGGYRDMFAALLGPAMPDLDLVAFDVHAGELPSSANACEAYLCTGSRYSVYETRDWILELADFVRKLHRSGTPFVGVCFGHQMLARALGGEVARASSGWGIGVHAMTIIKREPWMQPARDVCKLHYMHADQVTRLPEKGVALAVAEHCPAAMLAVGNTMLGIEGHPEFPATYERALLEARRSRIGDAAVEAALASLVLPTDAAIMGNWIAGFLTQALKPGGRAA